MSEVRESSRHFSWTNDSYWTIDGSKICRFSLTGHCVKEISLADSLRDLDMAVFVLSASMTPRKIQQTKSRSFEHPYMHKLTKA